MRSRPWCACCLALLAGCAPFEPPRPGADHPANPRAAAAPQPPASDVLSIDDAALPRMPPEMRRAGHTGHTGHGGGAGGHGGGQPAHDAPGPDAGQMGAGP